MDIWAKFHCRISIESKGVGVESEGRKAIKLKKSPTFGVPAGLPPGIKVWL